MKLVVFRAMSTNTITDTVDIALYTIAYNFVTSVSAAELTFFSLSLTNIATEATVMGLRIVASAAM